MSVFPYTTMTAIAATLRAVCTSALAKTPLYLSKEEFVEAFIRPEHVEKLREVYDLIGSPAPSGGRANLCVDSNDLSVQLRATMSFFGRVDLLVPQYAYQTYDYHSPTGQRVLEWGAERRRMGLLLGDAADAIGWLNETCGNAKAFSLMFPVLPSLMVRTGDVEGSVAKRGRSINNTQKIGTLPALPREVINRMREASAMVQVLMMTEDAVVEPPKGAVLSMYSEAASTEQGNLLEIYKRKSLTNPNFNTTTFI